MAALCLPSDHVFCDCRLSAIVQARIIGGWSANRKYPFHPSDGPPTAILPLHWASPAPATIVRRSGRSRAVKIAEDPPLQVLEEVGDFLAGLFGVVDRDVLALFGADDGIAAHGLAGVPGGMPGNFEGFLGAI